MKGGQSRQQEQLKEQGKIIHNEVWLQGTAWGGDRVGRGRTKETVKEMGPASKVPGSRIQELHPEQVRKRLAARNVCSPWVLQSQGEEGRESI